MVLKSIQDMKRVWKVTKKPTKKEYFTTVKIVLIGLVIIGLIGFINHLLWELVFNRFF